MNLAWPNIERDIVQRDDAGKALARVLDYETHALTRSARAGRGAG